MTIVERIMSLFSLRTMRRPGLRDPALTSWYGGEVSTAGVQVSESTALSYAPFWQAVRIISLRPWLACRFISTRTSTVAESLLMTR